MGERMTKADFETLLKRHTRGFELISEARRARESEEQKQALIERLAGALSELETWWTNWMPDDAAASGGLKARDLARAALSAAGVEVKYG